MLKTICIQTNEIELNVIDVTFECDKDNGVFVVVLSLLCLVQNKITSRQYKTKKFK